MPRSSIGRRAVLAAVALYTLTSAALAAPDDNSAAAKESSEIRAQHLRVGFDAQTGQWEFVAAEGMCAKGVTAALEVGGHTVRTSDKYRRRSTVSAVRDLAGEAQRLTARFDGLSSAPDLTVEVTVFAGKPLAIVDLTVRNTTPESVKISNFSLWQTDQGLSLGAWDEDPATVLVDSGSCAGTNIRELSGNEMTSDGQTAIFNPAGPAAFVCGFLGLDRGSCRVKVRRPEADGGASVAANWGFSATLAPGETLQAPRLLVDFRRSPHEALEQYADLVHELNRPPVPKDVLVGWISWYCYRLKMTEKIILMNARVMADAFGDYGFEIVQLDHGWQFGHDANAGIYPSSVWVANGRFPHGIKWLGQRLEEMGLKLGLWTSPYAVHKDDPFAREHPEAVRKHGWGALRLDTPAGEAFLHDLGRKLKDYGAKYVKLDFGISRKGADILRSELGPDVYLRSCGSSTNSLLGCMNLVGLQRDIGNAGGNFKHLQIYMQDIAPQWFKNRRYWLNVIDVLIVGDPHEPPGEARARCAMLGLSGAKTFLGDNMVRVKYNRPDRFAMISTVLPPYGAAARPVDLFRRPEQYSTIWHLPVKKQWGNWDVVAVFNYDEQPQTQRIRLADLGLPAGRSSLVFDFWREQFAGIVEGDFDVAVPPGDVRLLAIHVPGDRPTVVGTNMHVTSGGVELGDVRWDAASGQLSGTCSRARGAKGSIFVYVPEGFRAEPAETAAMKVRPVAADLARVDLTFPEKTQAWSVQCGKGEQAVDEALREERAKLLSTAAADAVHARVLAARKQFAAATGAEKNLALASKGARASAQSVYSDRPDHQPSVAIDGNIKAVWGFCSGRELPTWLQIAWPEAQTFNTVVIYHPREERYATDWTIDVWQDDKWTPVARVEGYHGHPRHTVHTFPAVTATKVRMHATAKCSPHEVGVVEFEVYNLDGKIADELRQSEEAYALRRKNDVEQTCFGPDLALGAQVNASGGENAENVNNGNVAVTSELWGGPQMPDAGWQSGPQRPAWIEIQWPQPVSFNMVVVHHPPDDSYATDWDIQTWDGAQWATCASGVGYAGGTYEAPYKHPVTRRSIHAIPRTKTTKLRMRITKGRSPGQLRVVELEAYDVHPMVLAEFEEYLRSETMTAGDAERILGRK